MIALTGGDLKVEKSTIQGRPTFFQGVPLADVPRWKALGWELTGTEADGWVLLTWSGDGKVPRPAS